MVNMFMLSFFQEHANVFVLFTTATACFLVHSYVVVSRFFKFEILEIHKVLYNQSLPLPLISLTLASKRNTKSSQPFLDVYKFEALLNRKPIPSWAYVHERYMSNVKLQNNLYINVVNASNYAHVKALEVWPLRSGYVTGERDNGFAISVYFNASNFVEEKKDGDKDKIMLQIISFDIDPNELTDTIGVPENLLLLPCHDVSIAVRLQRSHLIDRIESPCQNDYPEDLRKLVNSPLKPERLYNALLAPNLPYDQRVCDNMCLVNYWLPICHCIMSYEIWHYAGGQANNSLIRQGLSDSAMRYATSAIFCRNQKTDAPIETESRNGLC